jgi:hypothetical protein
MKERILPLICATLFCIISAAVGAVVGYRLGGFSVWPNGESMLDCALYGSLIGAVGAIVTGFLLLAAAREKLWLVTLIGCLTVFGGGFFYGNKQANDLHEWSSGFFRSRYLKDDSN